MFRPVLIAAPTETPISVAEVRANSIVEDPAQEAFLTALIAAATGHLDGWTGILGRCLCTQTWRQDYTCFMRNMRLPLVPVASVTSVKYYDAAGDEQTYAASTSVLLEDELGAYVRFKDEAVFPAVRSLEPAVNITYVAGTAAAAVPASIKQAMLLLVGHWNENRESVNIGNIVNAIPMAFDALIAPHRRIRF